MPKPEEVLADEVLAEEDNFDSAFADAIASADEPDEKAVEAKAADDAALVDETEPEAEPAAEVKVEPAAEVKVEPVAELEAEPVAEVKGEPAAEVKPEPVAEVKPEPVAEVKPEPVAEVKPEPVAEVKPEPAQTPEEMEAALLASIPDPVASEEYTAKIAKFKEDWPDIAEAVDMQAAHQAAQMEARVARLVSSVVQSIYSDVAPMAKSYANTEATSFRSTVVGAHTDYDQVFPALEPWIKSQPAYLQSGMLQAYNAGSAADVIDLVTRYKAATGSKPQVHEPAPEQPGTKPNLKAAAKAAELSPVSAKRTAPRPTGEDPNDFDGAFAEAAESYS